MIRSNQPWRPLHTAILNWTSDNTPKSDQFNDFYYSSDDGLAESEYVFLTGNRLPNRWSSHPHPTFRVVETGFGTGLNFLLTWQLWQSQPHPRPQLHFISIEKHPLKKTDLIRALANWPALAELSATLIAIYPPAIAGQHRLVFDEGAVILDLWLEDGLQALEDLASHRRKQVDCWYLDGFAPRQNPAMWTDALFQSMTALSREGASFATFTAASSVRRALQTAGFEVSRLPGFGKKRESLHGQLETIKPTVVSCKPPNTTPWDVNSGEKNVSKTALVIGAGIAGCTIAAALAQRNIKVVILERGKVANAGSGNDQGVLYTRLSTRHSPLSDFSLQSFLFATRFYKQLFLSGALLEHRDGSLCGSFHQSDKPHELEALGEILANVPDLAQVLSAAEANQHLGISQQQSGYWYPGSGWMCPRAVCRAMLANNNIQLIENTGTLELQQGNQGWAAVSESRVIAEAGCAVIAAGTSSGQLPGLNWLPLQAIRGQTTTVPTSAQFGSLRAALCHKGYVTPARLDSHCIGATFNTEDPESAVREADQQYNLEALANAAPEWGPALAALGDTQLPGRVGYRCASPDYLPLVGSIPNRTHFLRDYAGLRKNARRAIATEGSCIPNLYLSTGHGSRGLSSTPLAAEIIASLICDEPLPLSRELYRAIAPARFLIRDLKRKTI